MLPRQQKIFLMWSVEYRAIDTCTANQRLIYMYHNFRSIQAKTSINSVASGNWVDAGLRNLPQRFTETHYIAISVISEPYALNSFDWAHWTTTGRAREHVHVVVVVVVIVVVIIVAEVEEVTFLDYTAPYYKRAQKHRTVGKQLCLSTRISSPVTIAWFRDRFSHTRKRKIDWVIVRLTFLMNLISACDSYGTFRCWSRKKEKYCTKLSRVSYLRLKQLWTDIWLLR